MIRKMYKLGIALGGGGARGFAHIGVLQALHEAGLKPEIISGTSAGSLAGVLYADGYSPKEIMKLFKGMKFGKLAMGTIPRDGFFKTTGLQYFLEKNLRARTFEELEIPLRVVASDIENGKIRVFDSGEIIPTILASCTFPIVFTPVKVGGRYYIDGGVYKNLPVSVIRKECDKVIGVNISSVVCQPYKSSMKYILERSIHHLMASNTLDDCRACDYLIESEDISGYSLFDMDNVNKIYNAGYKVASAYFTEKKEKLKQDFFDPVSASENKSNILPTIFKYLFLPSKKW